MIDINAILTSLADDVIERAQRNLGAYRMVKIGNKSYRRRAVASGKLKNSLGYSIRKGGASIDIVFGAGGDAKNYYRVVNDGRKAGTMPPLNAIVNWMKQKPIRLRSGNKFVKTTEKGQIRAAYAISKAIQKRGIAPFPYYTDALRDVMEDRADEVKLLIEHEIKTEIQKWQSL